MAPTGTPDCWPVVHSRPGGVEQSDIGAGGHQLWLDRDLHGGEDWWARILERIRSSAVVIFAISEGSLRSQACRPERDYARALGIPVIPVQVGPVQSRIATSMSEYQIIDYQ